MLKYKKSVYVLGVIAAILFLCMFWILISCANTSNVTTNITNEGEIEMPTVYDSVVLRETNMFCPFCGDDTVAVNGEIVCRNESCEMYGLPVRVAKYDGSMDGNYEFYYGE